MLFQRILFNRYSRLNLFRSVTTNSQLSTVKFDFKDGLAHLTVPLPSRNESCVFQLKPFNTTIGQFLDVIKEEDRGIDRAAIYLSDGSRLSRNSPLELIFQEPFTLCVNEISYDVQPPALFSSNEPVQEIVSDVSNSITKLYHDLRLNQTIIHRERQLEQKLESLRKSIQPLDELHHQLAKKAIRRLKWFQWSIFAGMALQTGVLFHVIYFDYSWDIVEPYTYFITYSTVVVAYCYSILRRHPLDNMHMTDCSYLKNLHRLLRKHNFDFERYNALKNEIMMIEHDLQRFKDPLERFIGVP